jgi:serine/threonine protein kinase
MTEDTSGEVVTATGSGSHPTVFDLAEQSNAADHEPNGLWVGPQDDPDRFELCGRGIRGGEGTTFRAWYHGAQGAPLSVALKRLSRPARADAAWPTSTDWSRWRDHVHLVQQIRHPNLVQLRAIFGGAELHQAGQQSVAGDGTSFVLPYVVMEWVQGATLDTLLRGRGVAQLSSEELARVGSWLLQLGSAVTALHSHTRTSGNPLVHRDVKPSNCMVEDHSERLILIDVGTLRRLEGEADTSGLHSAHYTAPEALQDPTGARDAAVDLFGVGAVAFFALTGEDPPRASEPNYLQDAGDRLRTCLRGLRLGRRRSLERIVLTLLSPDPSHRAGRSAESWTRDLATALASRRSKHRRLVAGAVALATAAAGIFTYAITYDSTPQSTQNARQADLRTLLPLRPFGTSYGAVNIRSTPTSVTISPPEGDDLYKHLWGAITTGVTPWCASDVSFDLSEGDHVPGRNRGIGIAGRATLTADQPSGFSAQYEFITRNPASDPDDSDGTWQLRPTLLPGGGFSSTTNPVTAPDLSVARHVEVSSIGSSLTIIVDNVATSWDVGSVECGALAIRAWGGEFTISNVKYRAS